MSKINHRRILVNFWRQFYLKWQIPKGYHVHHIKPRCTFADQDDLMINYPSNLVALHPDDHATIHRLRGDKRVSRLILSVNGRVASDKYKASVSGENNFKYVGYYITPFGKFSSAKDAIEKLFISEHTLSKWCKNNNHVTKQAITNSPYLKDTDVGKTFREIGFSFKTHK